MTRSQAQKRPRSRSSSPSASSGTSTSETWRSRKLSRMEPFSDVKGDGEVSTGATSPASSFSPKPDEKHSQSSHANGLSNGDTKIKAQLPTPFWPVSLQQTRLQELKTSGGDQPPALPAVFPAVPLNITPAEVANPDVRTPDNWVNRNPGLIRLTGKHPFNTEGPLDDVFGQGFLTPAHLHVVRNHGAVPRLPAPAPFNAKTGEVEFSGITEDAKLSLPRTVLSPSAATTDPYADWTIRVHGLVEHEVTLSIRELAERFQVVTLPVTIVCAGNRRREQNVVRKSLGFDWGAAGVSTALWTGVYLADVLEYVRPVRGTAKHVIFEGADALPKGPYGTSQKLSWAADRMKGMMLAWAMNGLPLEPDHGFPVRVVIPGQIGGRMVKWLTRIEVSDVESNHHLHYWDNKVLPMQLSPEQARDEPKWWYDPRYVITELNVNSAIARPAHGETLALPASESSTDDKGKTYTMKGYAYAGGGRRISRVEISWDDGRTWLLAEVDYPEDQFRRMKFEHPVYGLLDLTERDTCFCWCFWTFEIPLEALANADVLYVRAMDEGMNTQPRDMYLNATSMLNNWWFRVAIRRTSDNSGVNLQFEHPAPVGTNNPGWMEKMKAEGGDILRPVFSTTGSGAESSKDTAPVQVPEKKAEVCMTKPGVDRKITAAEVQAQDKAKPWFVVNGEVYDGTDYLKDHPGGADSILIVAGEDATEDFMAIHSADAKKKLAEYHIGTLAGTLESATPVPEDTHTSDPNVPFLSPKIWKSVVLTKIERVNHDSLTYTFSLGSSDQRLGLPVGQHVFVRLRRKDNGEMVQRAYTPVSREDARGSLDFLIKLYLPCDGFPEGGKMSMGFHQLEVGDSIEVKGPLGSFVYQGSGNALWKGVPRKLSEIGLVCGGSGITPILQVIRSVLHDTADETIRLYLISANKTEVDILCKEELDAYLHAHNASRRFHLHYVLGKPPAEGWTYSTGRVDDQMLREHLPEPGADRMVLACGPPAMVDGTVRDGLKRLGWDVDTSYVVF